MGNSVFFFPVDDFSRYDITLATGVSTKFTDHLSIRLELHDEYENEPTEADVPRNDMTIIVGIGYDF